MANGQSNDYGDYNSYDNYNNSFTSVATATRERETYSTIYCDIDDVFLNSSETVVQILNNRYNINPQKSAKDIYDWGYRSIVDSISKTEILEIFDSDDFWRSVKVNPDFLTLMSLPFINHYPIMFVTKGTATNIWRKEFLVRDIMASYPSIRYDYIGLEPHQSKGRVDMSDGIQIDDNYYYMDTNAKMKYLLKNHRETDYNQCPINRNEFYTINSINEFIEILKFDFEQRGAFFKNGY